MTCFQLRNTTELIPIKSRSNKGSFLITTGWLGSLLLALTGDLAAQPAAPRPNIVFILADDLGYGDLGVYGQELIRTPNIDKLARRGMRFTNFYAGSTVCAPSRAALMTGQHTGHVYVRGNGEIPLRQSDTTLAERLRSAGYTNGMVGKWGLGLQHTTGVPEAKGWDFFSGHLHHVEGHYQQPDSAWQLVNGSSTRVAVPAGVYANEWFRNEAIRFLQQQRPSNPFFLYVSFTLPHAELVTHPKFLERYTRKGRSRFQPETEQPAGRHYGPQPMPKAAYAAMVSEVDHYVGSILRALRKLNLDDNTLVVFASDNGTHVEGGRTLQDAMQVFRSSGPLRGVKRDLYEGGIRIPFIVNWKGRVQPGATNPHAGAFWDMPATFAELAGISSPGNTQLGDGLSFLPSLLGQQQPSHEFLYWEFNEGGFKQAVRKANWKAIRYFREGRPYRTELYDLEKDPSEKQDLARDQPSRVTEMEALMDRAHRPSEHPLFRPATAK